jgi:hypothetical protein
MTNKTMTLPIFILFLIIGIDFLYPFFFRYFGFPPLPPSTIEFVKLALFLITFIKILFKNKKFINSDSNLLRYRYFILIFLLIAIISSVINYNNLFLVAKVFLDFSFINLVLFFTILELDLNEKQQKNIIRFIYVMIFIQIPVSIYQYLFLHYPSADYNSGTISFAGKNDGTGIVAILMTFLLSLIISKILIQGFTIKRFILTILTFIPPIVGGSKLGLILSPLTIFLTVISYFIFYSHFDLLRFFRITLLSGIIIIISILAIIIVVPQTRFGKEFLDLSNVSSPERIVKSESADPRYGRVAGYSRLFDNVFKNKMDMFLGVGSDAIAQSKFADVSQPKFLFITRVEDSIRLLGTTGLLGLLIVMTIIFLGIPTLKGYIKVEPSEFMKVIACSFIPSTMIFLGAIFYTSAWATQIGLCYWIILGVLYQRYSVLSRGYEKLSRYYLSFMTSS